MGKAHFGLIGLGVMGENLVLNMESHGFTVAITRQARNGSTVTRTESPYSKVPSMCSEG